MFPGDVSDLAYDEAHSPLYFEGYMPNISSASTYSAVKSLADSKLNPFCELADVSRLMEN